MKMILAIALSCVTLFSLASDIMIPTAEKRGEPIFKSEKAKDNYMRMTGGTLQVILPGKPFVFADMRKVHSSDIQGVVEKISESTRIKASYKSIDENEHPFIVAKQLIANGTAGAITILYDGGISDPVLTVYPEDRISLINVMPLQSANYMKRLEREMWRGFAYAAGGTTSPTEICVMQPIFSPEDLDSLQCDMAYPGVTGQVINNAAKYGFAKIMKGTYRGACKAGWAPPPTNDYQRAIWNQMAKEKQEAIQEPSAPIKIKYDKNKGK